ncbi:DUF389 domain-containing protein [Nocardioides ganghwensis]|jgi:uncharacterized hydrophobic protein (TIGR00271 family)|uniref:DUF389 domain-containing protein n=1 Tax=Nocardioides ganghwensis TaxID=252230 RepID=A0A4Q2S8Q3_9ACTN|nr:DUF389 domain-containing protein [Nocardioides ganghwensis]MBD3944375.1 DUF389 domain-containing protein [Nocardioides ganghwensis]RYB96953.1 DUF389 domain-containing protein [Nocardioides ganghwensis]
MLVHLRLTVPTHLADDVVDLLRHDDRSANLTRHVGASLSPVGDLVECDVARELAGEVIARLRDLGLHDSGGIVVTTPTSTPFTAARRLERAAPGDPDDAVIWDTVIEQCYAASRTTVSYYLFFVLASLLAAIAVITDSAVLVIGAMVVGPEFGTVAAIATGLVFGRPDLTGRALRLLVSGIAVAVAVVALLSLVGDLTGLITSDMVTRPRPQTGFIWHPDQWSFIVALIAGAAGVLALTTARANAMVGVFISVTTIPAVGNLALALGVWAPSEIRGSAAQLAVNLAGMVLAGAVVLVLQRLLWVRALAAAQRLLSSRGQRATR